MWKSRPRRAFPRATHQRGGLFGQGRRRKTRETNSRRRRRGSDSLGFRPQAPCDQAESAGEKGENDERAEKARRAEEDRQVRDDAEQDDQRATGREEPAELRA